MTWAGFTKWSSERSPNEVFKLLEQIFWEFDEIAASLNVFKLGTIGDCYIAVAGIPKPVKDHAVLLTQFAFDARDKVREVCARLEAEGLDTAKLDMRFGIHSGDTTAGILRGAKSRFELFGDTINTASRMESTGLPGKIQVSEETAMLIQRDSKSQWLTKRDTLVAAKGKGELQTYWAEPHRSVFFSDKENPSQGSSLRSSILQRTSLLQWRESGEDGIDSTGDSRRPSMDLEEVTAVDVGNVGNIATLDSSKGGPVMAKVYDDFICTSRRGKSSQEKDGIDLIGTSRISSMNSEEVTVVDVDYEGDNATLDSTEVGAEMPKEDGDDKFRSESGESSQEKDGVDFIGTSRRSSVNSEEVTFVDVGNERDIATF